MFPAGTGILINIGKMNFNSRNYPNPLEFNPKNFEPIAEAERSKYSFIPFGAGKRQCPGITSEFN